MGTRVFRSVRAAPDPLPLLFLTAALALLPGCERYFWQTPPNVLFISMDTTRADHCSVDGYDRDTTPTLRRLADQGARFDLAYAPTSTTAPSHATMFTGLYPITHGVRKNGIRLADSFTTLAEMLRDDGYQTAAYVSSFAMAGKFGFEQGFSVYDDDFTREASTYRLELWQGHAVEAGFDRRATATATRAVDWLRNERAPNRPFFLFVHFFDPHDPYDPPERFAEHFPPPEREYPKTLAGAGAAKRDTAIARYDAEIAYTDFEIARLLDALEELDLADETLVIVTADHGEGLMDHGYLLHGVHIYEEQVRVPFVVRWPGRIAAGRVLSAPIEMVDVVPTVLDFVGRKQAAAGYAGQSLAAALAVENSEPLDPERPVYLYRQHFRAGVNKLFDAKGEKFGIRRGPWKCILGQEENTRELFNLDADPGELDNLWLKDPLRLATMTKQIRDWRERYGTGEEIAGRTEDDIEKLRALGYAD